MLQFEVVASRLLNEYGVDAVFEGTSISSARWVSSDDKRALADFETQLGHNVAYDAAGNLAYLATSGVNLRLTQERWPKLTSTPRANTQRSWTDSARSRIAWAPCAHA